jgi:hypothetical protein
VSEKYNEAPFTQFLTTVSHLGRFQILMAASMKMIIFWDIALCSVVNTD